MVEDAIYWAGVLHDVAKRELVNMRSMARPGVTFTKEQDAEIHALVESGDVTGAQRIILDALEAAFKQTS